MQKVWITGASSGIGEALVRKYLQSGFYVIASSRTKKTLANLETNRNFTFIPLDVTDEDNVSKVCNIIRTKFANIDIAILNAGICEYIDMPNFDLQTINNNFKVNFFGAINCINYVMPLLEQSREPHLVAVSSSAAYLPFPRAEGYGASKAALLYLLRSMQADKKPSNLNINIVCPGFVKTPLTDRNDFAMPFLVDAEYAANAIFKGVKFNKQIIEFPAKLIWVLKLIAALPRSWQTKILEKMSNRK